MKEYRIVELLYRNGTARYIVEMKYKGILSFTWWYEGGRDTFEEAMELKKELEDKSVISKTVIK